MAGVVVVAQTAQLRERRFFVCLKMNYKTVRLEYVTMQRHVAQLCCACARSVRTRNL